MTCPALKIRRISIIRPKCLCPICGSASARHSIRRRRLYELGIDGPTMVEVWYSIHHCEACKRHFNVSLDHIAPPRGRYTWRVILKALDYLNTSKTLTQVSEIMLEKHFVKVPSSTLHDWLMAATAAA